MKPTNTKIITLIISMFLIAGCGGDGSSDEVSLDSLLVTVPDNISPVANVNKLNISVVQGQTVNLDASESYDEDGNIVSYQWQLANGTNLAEGQQLSYNTGSLNVGTYKLRLIVTDDDGATGVTEVTVTVQARPEPAPTTDEPTEPSPEAEEEPGEPSPDPDPTDTTPPVFTSSSTASVNENQTSAITLVATDESAVTYSISGTDAGSFSVNASTGVVTFNTVPDFEVKDSYTFTATATDASGNETTQTVTIIILDIVCEIHNGIEYCPVVSPYTGKVWLDRNIGAARVCESSTDTACYGDYFHWGRNLDGHEDSLSATTSTKATNVTNVGHGDFITGVGDWASVDEDGSIRQANWSKTDGSSVCPTGFRVPNINELEAEIDIDTGHVIDELNFALAGRRSSDGNMHFQDNIGFIWSTSVSGLNSFHLDIFTSSSNEHLDERTSGRSVRCIQN